MILIFGTKKSKRTSVIFVFFLLFVNRHIHIEMLNVKRWEKKLLKLKLGYICTKQNLRVKLEISVSTACGKQKPQTKQNCI